LFPGFLTYFGNLGFGGSAVAAQGLATNQSSGGEKNYVVYGLFCILIITIIIIIVSIINSSISFVALSNCLYLNPRVSPCVHCSSPSQWGEGEG